MRFLNGPLSVPLFIIMIIYIYFYLIARFLCVATRKTRFLVFRLLPSSAWSLLKRASRGCLATSRTRLVGYAARLALLVDVCKKLAYSFLAIYLHRYTARAKTNIYIFSLIN